jgi:hypothetical protein
MRGRIRFGRIMSSTNENLRDLEPRWFTTVCPSCKAIYRLLERNMNRKVMCGTCGMPFIATNTQAGEIEVHCRAETPEIGWLLVCPACAHTELVAADVFGPAHCSRCVPLCYRRR